MLDHIPIIDLSPLLSNDAKDSAWDAVAKSVYNALSGFGFLYLTGHGIPKEKIENAFKASKSFFELPIDTKLKYKKQIYSGYLGGDFAFNPGRIHELRELYDRCGPTVWPNNECPEFQHSMDELEKENNKLGRIIFKLLAKSLGLDDDTFYKNHLGLYSNDFPSQYTHRALHYPPLYSKYGEFPGAMRCCEHTDYGTVTLLFQDDNGGLEIQAVNKDWIPAKPIPDTILINTGDLLELWSGGQFPATPHRVTIPKDETKRNTSRYCLSYFIYPDMAANVTPLTGKVHPKFANLPVINAGEYFQHRIDYTHNVELKAGVNAVPGYFNNTV